MNDLSKMHTRQLMALRNRSYKTRECPCCGEPQTPEDRAYNEEMYELRRRVKAELATREHIPNKLEAKAIRQAAAKRGR